MKIRFHQKHYYEIHFIGCSLHLVTITELIIPYTQFSGIKLLFYYSIN